MRGANLSIFIASITYPNLDWLNWPLNSIQRLEISIFGVFVFDKTVLWFRHFCVMLLETCGMFDSTYFNNSKVFCLTPIKSWNVWLELCSMENWQLLNKPIVKHNHPAGQVWQYFSSTLIIKHNISQTKS